MNTEGTEASTVMASPGFQREMASLENSTVSSASKMRGSRRTMAVLLVAYALVGFTALVYEVAWTRALATVLGSSIYAFGAMLGAFLSGIAIGSLLIRLLPASGTLPPPIGLHGTLASWLDMERKTRAAVEDERDAFARRVGEMHHQLQMVMSARTMDPDAPELARQRDEADALARQLHALNVRVL